MVSKETFEHEVLRLLPSLGRVARRFVRNDADAEDLVAETVARAWRALPTLQSDSAFRGWIFRILHNTFVSDFRRTRARPEVASADVDCDDAEFSLYEQLHQPFLLWYSNPEQAFLDKLLREDLERAMEALPEHHRTVVVLADLEEFTYGEIAEALGVPVGTVRSRLARARCALQKRLWQQAQAYGLTGEAAARNGSRLHERQG